MSNVMGESYGSSSSVAAINSTNIGFQLLKKHGWKEGTGLGIAEQDEEVSKKSKKLSKKMRNMMSTKNIYRRKYLNELSLGSSGLIRY